MRTGTLAKSMLPLRTILRLANLAVAIVVAPLHAQELVWPRNQISISHVGVVRSEDFTYISAALWTSDGRILVADGGSYQVMLFVPNGDLVWSSGRQGRGPGEYTALSSMVRCQDGSLAAYDRTLARLTVISDAGKVLGTHAMPVGLNGRLLHCAGGPDAVFEIPGLNAPPEPGRQQWRVLAVHVRGGKVDTIASGYSDSYVANTRALYVVNPLGETVELAAGGSAVYVCQRAQGRCVVYDAQAGRRDSFEVALPRRPLSRAVWEARIRDWVKPPAPSRAPAMERQLLDLYHQLPKPDHFPRFEAIAADGSGRLWAKVDSTRWLVLSRTGQPVATAALPATIRILSIGQEMLLGVSSDDDGIPQIDLYRLSGPTGSQ